MIIKKNVTAEHFYCHNWINMWK